MKKKILTVVLAIFLFFGFTGPVHAVSFDQNVIPDVIFGSGNANGSFTVDNTNGIELGLRGKLRHDTNGFPQNTFNSNGDGTYNFNAGVAPTQPYPTAEWSFEWSVNSNVDGSGNFLNQFTYLLGIDSDPTVAAAFTTFDPINIATGADHAIGDNNTGNGGGTSIPNNDPNQDTLYAALIGTNNVAQNSWKPHWFINPFDPTVDGTYDFFLEAFDANGASLARTEIQIIVGQGGAPIPEPTTSILFGLGLIGLAGAVRSKQ